MSHCRDLTGNKYTRLTVLFKTAQRDSCGSVVWRCRCDCGNETFVSSRLLNSGNTQSCGCLNEETQDFLRTVANVKHGASLNKVDGSIHPLYRIWQGIKGRCYNKNNKRYYRYGARGISMHKPWRDSYSVFRDYILRLPGCPEGLEDRSCRSIAKSLDRVHNDKNYEPKNLRWASDKQQANNRSNNKMRKINGVRMTFAEAVEKYAVVPYSLAHQRVNRDGWPIKKAFLTPKK
jgi:hypothetical protein